MVNAVALEQTIRMHQRFFGQLAIQPHSDAASVLAVVEFADRAPRWRGYGYLFGYPDEAVEFFVTSGQKGDSIDRVNRARGLTIRSYVEPRDFRLIETFRKSRDCDTCAAARSSFVYAVSKNAPVSAADVALTTSAAQVYAEYVRRRQRYITASNNGIVELLREWLITAESSRQR